MATAIERPGSRNSHKIMKSAVMSETTGTAAASRASASSSKKLSSKSTKIQVNIQLPANHHPQQDATERGTHRLPVNHNNKSKSSMALRFFVTVSDLQKREKEMQQTAQEFQIPTERWKGSRLYGAWKHAQRRSPTPSQQQQQSSSGVMVLTIDPTQPYPKSSQEQPSSPLAATPWWQSWLAPFLQQYYQTGKLIVSKDCQGPDLLYCLESFGILYAPTALHFPTAGPYWKIKYWSEYLTQRPILAEHILDSMEVLHQQQHQLALSSPSSPLVFFWGTTLHTKERLAVSPKQMPDNAPTLPTIHAWSTERDVAKLVFQLFNDSAENLVAAALRQDFARYLTTEYVQQDADDVLQAEFTCKSVQISYDGNPVGRERRAILRVEWKDPEGNHNTSATNAATTNTRKASPYRGGNRDKQPSRKEQNSATYDEHGMLQEKDPVVMYSPVNTKEKISSHRKSASSSPTDVKEELQYASSRTPIRTPHRRGNRQSPVPQRPKSSPLRASNPAPPPTMAGFMMMHPAALGMPAPPPVDVIDADEEAHTVVSGLTSPFATDLDSVLGTPKTKKNEYRAEALRQEWVQGTLLNKDVPQEMRRLLEEEEYPAEDAQDNAKEEKKTPEGNSAPKSILKEGKGTTSSGKTAAKTTPPRTPPRATPLHYEKAMAQPQTPEQLRSADDPLFQDSPTHDCSWDWMNKLCQPHTSSMTAATEPTTTTVWTSEMCIGDACDPQPDMPTTVKTVSQSSQSTSKTAGSSPTRPKSLVQERMDKVQKLKLEKANKNKASKQANSIKPQKDEDTTKANGGSVKKAKGGKMGKLFGRNKKQ